MFYCRFNEIVGWLVAASLLVGCSGSTQPTVTEVQTVVIRPVVVERQVLGGEFVSRAFSDSLASALAQASGLKVRVEPEADWKPTPDEEIRIVTGSLRREEQTVHIQLQMVDAAMGPPVWETQLSSAEGVLSKLASRLARRIATHLNLSLPRLYGSMDDLTAGAALAATTEWTQAREWRGQSVQQRLDLTSKLVRDHPADPTAHVLCAWASMLAWDANPSDDSYLVQLREQLGELDRIDPTSPYDELMRAYVFRASGEPNRSRDLCSRAIDRQDLTPAARAWAFRQRALAHLQAGNAEAARHDSEQAAQLDPANALNLIALSKSLESLGEFDAAIDVSKQALMLEPYQWRHHQRLGIVYGRAGRHETAIRSVEESCRLSDSQEACANLAVTLERANRRKEAKAAADYASSLPGTAFGQYNLACYSNLSGDQPTALANLKRAVGFGFADLLIETDADLNTLRSDAAFAAILTAVQERLRDRRKISGSVFPWQS